MKQVLQTTVFTVCCGSVGQADFPAVMIIMFTWNQHHQLGSDNPAGCCMCRSTINLRVAIL